MPRHQTLRALIDWSYDLLTPAEQRLLCRLSVFAGGFTLDAVEGVCAGKDEGDVLELLAQLVHKSLVVTKREPGQEARYHLLETIRQYAWAKLAAGSEAGPAQTRHLDFFLQLAETAEPQLSSGEQLVWLDRLEAEHDNLRAALAWSLEKQNGDVESGLRLATALLGFWEMRSHFGEGRRWLDTAMAKRHRAVLPVQARLILNTGWLWLEQGESDPTALLQESLALYRQLDDKRGIAWNLCCLGWCAFLLQWDPVTTSSLWEESLSLAVEVDDKPLMTRLYYGLARLSMDKGDSGQATKLSSSGLILARETGDRWENARLLFILGRSARQQRDYARAAMLFQESLALARELNDMRGEGILLNALGEVARVQRAYGQAAVFYHESLAHFREVDIRVDVALVLHNLGLADLGRGDRLQARSLFRESIALAQEMKQKDIISRNVWGLAAVALEEGHTRRAAQLFAAAPLMDLDAVDPVDQEDYERDVTLARAQLGEEAFAAAWAKGQAMSLEEAIVYALEESFIGNTHHKTLAVSLPTASH